MALHLSELAVYPLGPTSEEVEITDPEVASIMEHTPLVDGTRSDQLVVRGRTEDGQAFTLALEGGGDGRVDLFAEVLGTSWYLRAVDADHDDTLVLRTSGGQETDMFRRWLVPWSDAVDAMLGFLERGELPAVDRWEEFDGSTFEEAIRSSM